MQHGLSEHEFRLWAGVQEDQTVAFNSSPGKNRLQAHPNANYLLLSACNVAVGALLAFRYYSVTEEFINRVSSSTLLIYFSTMRRLAPPTGSHFLYPNQFTPILSRLIYLIRLIYLEVLLLRLPHPSIDILARPRVGQLQRLDEVWQKSMYDGILSPIGEFISLLLYRYTLRRSTLLLFCFKWSEDRQEISWDGQSRLSIDCF